MNTQLNYALLLLLGLSAVPALGSPGGELDPGFGDHGRVLLRESRFQDLAGSDVFVDPISGKLLVVADGYGRDALLRFNSDGSLDPDFGDRGLVRLNLGDDDAGIYAVKLLADGKLLIAGAVDVYGTPDDVVHSTAMLARFQADGTPDESFGSGGRANFQLGGVYESLSDILLQADGRIVVFGNTNRSGDVEMILARYTQDGLPDTSFGNGITPGTGVIDLMGVYGQLAAVVLQNDGKFLFCGDARVRDGISDSFKIMAIRVNPNGVPDVTFGNNGMRLIDGEQELVRIETCLELADGHLIFAGSVGSDKRQRAAVWRLTPDGRRDSGFGTNGMVVLDANTQSSVSTMLVMDDSWLAITGARWLPSADSQPDNNAWVTWLDMLVTRIDPTSGDIDRGFGNQGMTVVDFGAGAYASNAIPARIKQQPDGKLTIIGSQIDWYDWYPAFSIAITRVDPYGSGSNGWAGLIETYIRGLSTGGTVTLHVRRTGGSTGQLSVDYRTVDNSALAGTDYVASSGRITWLDGDLGEKSLSITINAVPPATVATRFNVELFNSDGGLAMDQATIGINRQSTPAGTRPPSGGNGGKAEVGGGALGFELLLLLVLGLFRAVRHGWYLPMQ